jgi:hypothetical protein
MLLILTSSEKSSVRSSKFSGDTQYQILNSVQQIRKYADGQKQSPPYVFILCTAYVRRMAINPLKPKLI